MTHFSRIICLYSDYLPCCGVESESYRLVVFHANIRLNVFFQSVFVSTSWYSTLRLFFRTDPKMLLIFLFQCIILHMSCQGLSDKGLYKILCLIVLRSVSFLGTHNTIYNWINEKRYYFICIRFIRRKWGYIGFKEAAGGVTSQKRMLHVP